MDLEEIRRRQAQRQRQRELERQREGHIDEDHHHCSRCSKYYDPLEEYRDVEHLEMPSGPSRMLDEARRRRQYRSGVEGIQRQSPAMERRYSSIDPKFRRRIHEEKVRRRMEGRYGEPSRYHEMSRHEWVSEPRQERQRPSLMSAYRHIAARGEPVSLYELMRESGLSPFELRYRVLDLVLANRAELFDNNLGEYSDRETEAAISYGGKDWMRVRIDV